MMEHFSLKYVLGLSVLTLVIVTKQKVGINLYLRAWLLPLAVVRLHVGDLHEAD